MSPTLPAGIQWPSSGRLDRAAAEVAAARPFSLYVHVPFCSVRCGYCDFNTYTVGFGHGAEPGSFAHSVVAEARLAANVLAEAGFPQRPANSVFFGGGTPSLLAASDLASILAALRDQFGLAPDAEITTEANPESVTPQYLDTLADAGFTRVSFGMQSSVPHVLATLDRTHRPERMPLVVDWARRAGLHTSVDLIYGTPGESLANWQSSLESAVALAPSHISAYALVIEEGTKMAAQVARGQLPTPSDDDEADKYELADRLLGEAGYRWYEISNFAKPTPGEEHLPAVQLSTASKHNLAYWRDHDWWGLGPGAHSHVGALRWWNVKHPRAYADRAAAGLSPAAAGEQLDASTRQLERVLLAIRTSEGLAAAAFAPEVVARLAAQGLIDAAALPERIVLTLHGRLLADTVVNALTD